MSSAAALPARLVIATRESALALVQARHIEARLATLYPTVTVELLGLTTTGDRELAGPLAEIGGKGLFIKELEEAMAAGGADLAVHSMKDVPAQLPPGFALAAITAREDPRDAFVSSRWNTLAELPPGARVGTSSLRRASQILARRPDLRLQSLRGNVQTRLRKLDEGECDAVILAAAGLKRLGLAGRIASLIEPGESIPAAGQGALGLECLAGRADLLRLLAPLADTASSACVRAERAVAHGLGGNCQVPLGAYAQMSGASLRLRAFVASPDGTQYIAAEQTGAAEAPEALGAAVAEALIAKGAREILALTTGAG